MARDAVDAAAGELGRHVPDCATDRIPLLGADGYHALANQTDALSRDLDLPVWRIEHLLNRYGAALDRVLAPAEDDPSLLAPVPGAGQYLLAELRWAASHEGALHLDDVLARRTRISIETNHRGVDSAAAAAAVVGDVLGWDAATREREVGTYAARVAAERGSQEASDDENADARRLVAPDTRRTVTGSRH
jgi:glycerol-3-phosphate dehydrogenase